MCGVFVCAVILNSQAIIIGQNVKKNKAVDHLPTPENPLIPSIFFSCDSLVHYNHHAFSIEDILVGCGRG